MNVPISLDDLRKMTPDGRIKQLRGSIRDYYVRVKAMLDEIIGPMPENYPAENYDKIPEFARSAFEFYGRKMVDLNILKK